MGIGYTEKQILENRFPILSYWILSPVRSIFFTVPYFLNTRSMLYKFFSKGYEVSGKVKVLFESFKELIPRLSVTGQNVCDGIKGKK